MSGCVDAEITADKRVVLGWTHSSPVKVYRLFTDVVELETLLKWKKSSNHPTSDHAFVL